MYVKLANSFCYVPETNTTLEIHHTLIKIKQTKMSALADILILVL